jgi:N-methylhydantoinase A/oxoprolinase/acetone carboxylase beta subunit
MFNKKTIGIDIGGTNTDAVLLEATKLLKKVKVPTTRDIETGIQLALERILTQSEVIDGIFVGTTHATNAILERNGLLKVGLLRLAGHYPDSISPCFGWPNDLKDALLSGFETVCGGFECDGTPISSLNPSEIITAVQRLLKKGAESIAIVGVFSPLCKQQEEEVASFVPNGIPVTLSHRLGGVGFIERENAALLNAALRGCLAKGFSKIESLARKLKIDAPIFFTQNNGTLLSLQEALETPILTLSAGPTNSFVGGAKIMGYQDAIIVDVGGTSTDVGLVKNGLPRRSLRDSTIGGVKLNFAMPDVISVALGGGSIICPQKKIIGPKSVALELKNLSQCFGGSYLTLTDLAVLLHPGLIEGTCAENIECSDSLADELMQKAADRIEKTVAQIAGKEIHLPVIMVGGGAKLFRSILCSDRYHYPENGDVANAFGAALAEVSAVEDSVISLSDRIAALEEIKKNCSQSAVHRGADPENVRIVSMEIIPYHYIPGQLARVIMLASGKRM